MLIKTFKIAFIAHETTILKSLCTILNTTEGVEVVGIFSNLNELDFLKKDKDIDIVLYHLMPKTDNAPLENNNKQQQYSIKMAPREIVIIDLLSEGLLYKEIANQLNITLGTLKQKIHKIYKKLEASNKTEALNRYKKDIAGLVE